MNFWAVLIIGGVLFLLLFSKNPIREFQEQQKALMEKYGTDELSIETNLYLEQQQPSQDGFTGFLGSDSSQEQPMDMTGSIVNSAESSNVSNNQNSATNFSIFGSRPQTNAAPAPAGSFDNDGQNKITITNTNANKYNNNIGALSNSTTTTPTADDNYYPPTINQATVPNKNAVSGNATKLRGGQPVSFDGTDVYVIDQHGNKNSLPDGIYTMQDGRQINVIGGKNVSD